MSSYGKSKKLKSGKAPSRARNFVFTLNNYTELDIMELTRVALHLNSSGKQCDSDVLLPQEQRAVQYIIWGKEVGEEKTEHLQGYLQMPKRYTFQELRQFCEPLKRAHIEVAKGSAAENYKYCTKGGDYTEHGQISLTQGLFSPDGFDQRDNHPFFLTHSDQDHYTRYYTYFSAGYRPTLLWPRSAPLVEWDGPLPLIPFPLLPSAFYSPLPDYFV